MSFKTTLFICLLFFFLSIPMVFARQDKPTSISRQQLKAKIDSLLLAEMEDNEISGLAYVIVKADSIFLSGAAGIANIENEAPVEAGSTLFLMGSNAKPVTATAVMQLVEKELLDLDRDVNSYLKSFQIPYKVTLRQLLTHTGGIEEQGINRTRLNVTEFGSLANYLKNHLPAQIFPPGTVGAYSNHGVALAGLVVEEVSGLPFHEYIQTHIFQPLDMSGATFSLSDVDNERLARSYDKKGSNWVDEGLIYVRTVPSAMLISTVTDMGHFMIAQLNSGRFENTSIMSPASIEQMQKQQFTHHPLQAGRALGLFEGFDKGKRVLTHGGTRQSHISYMYMVPEEQLGIYVAYNGSSGRFRSQFADHIIDLWLPDFPRAKQHFIQPSESLKEYTGTFYSNRRNETSIERLLQQFAVDKAQVSLSSDTSLRIFGGDFFLQSEDQFNTKSGSFPVSFGRDQEGKIQYLFLQGRADSYELFPWYKNEKLHAAILAVCLILFLILTIRFIINVIKRRQMTLLSKGTHWLAVNYFLFLITFIGAIAILQEALQYEIPVIFYFSFSLPFVGFVLVAVVIKGLFKNWQSLTVKAKAAHLAYLMVILLFNLELYYWNFIGYQF